jgi:hypothetical protein
MAMLGLLVCSFTTTASGHSNRRLLAPEQLFKPQLSAQISLSPTQTNIWTPIITTDSSSTFSLPIDGSAAADSAAAAQADNYNMTRLNLTVTFAHSSSFLLNGNVTISRGQEGASTPSNVRLLDAPVAVQAPSITITPSTGDVVTVSADSIKCGNLSTATGASATCSFTAVVPTPEGSTHPPTGSVSASFTVPGSNQSVQAPAASYSFPPITSLLPAASSAAVTTNNSAAMNDSATLCDRSSPAATAASYFVPGDGLLLPDAVSNNFPSDIYTVTRNSEAFTFLALFKNQPQELCGGKYGVSCKEGPSPQRIMSCNAWLGPETTTTVTSCK